MTCQGNQSAGVKDGTDFPANTTTIQLQNLNTNVSPASGTPGVNHFAQSGSGISQIDVKFSGGGFAISTSGNAAHGILAGGQGHDGGSGSSGGAFNSGGTGGLGGELGGLGVTANGTITTNGSGAHGIQAQALSGNAGGGGSSDCCNGGAGGEGGGGTTPAISGSGSITANGDQSAGINVTYRAGNGGNGGTGGAFGSGGHGGGGGGGANFFLSNTGDWAIATHGPTNSPGVRVELVSGNGGSGGASDSAFGDSGGSGGNGGSGLGAQPVFVGVSDVGAWTVTTAGTNSDGFFRLRSGRQRRQRRQEHLELGGARRLRGRRADHVRVHRRPPARRRDNAWRRFVRHAPAERRWQRRQWRQQRLLQRRQCRQRRRWGHGPAWNLCLGHSVADLRRPGPWRVRGQPGR